MPLKKWRVCSGSVLVWDSKVQSIREKTHGSQSIKHWSPSGSRDRWMLLLNSFLCSFCLISSPCDGGTHIQREPFSFIWNSGKTPTHVSPNVYSSGITSSVKSSHDTWLWLLHCHLELNGFVKIRKLFPSGHCKKAMKTFPGIVAWDIHHHQPHY